MPNVIPKFKYGSASDVLTENVSNGSLLVDITNGILYADLNNGRIPIAPVRAEAQNTFLSSVPAANAPKFRSYDGNLYWYSGSAWQCLTAPSVSIPRPAITIMKPLDLDESYVHLELQVSSTGLSGSYSTVINTKTTSATRAYVKVFDNNGCIVAFPSSGLDRVYNNRTVIVQIPEASLPMSSFYRYRWLHQDDYNTTSDWYGGYYPSSGDALANLGDRVANLEAQMRKIGVLVDELPADPDADTLYLIPEEEE